MSEVRNVVRPNFYRDSIQLLHISEEAKKLEGVTDAEVAMGTPTNKEVLQRLGLLTDEGKIASENDMILAVRVTSKDIIGRAFQQIDAILIKPPSAKGEYFYSLEAAFQSVPDANLAVVSVPGHSARDIVRKLLDKGIHVHLFSDHVPVDHELELKQLAQQRGLLLLGPEAGTAIINGKAIAFANAVRRGEVGIVAAAGTGLQEVSVLLSEAGLGISQALGTGGADVKSRISGMMTLECIDALEQDPDTGLVVVISKPVDPDLLRTIVQRIVNNSRKKYVTCFVGAQDYEVPQNAIGRVMFTKTLHAAALATMRTVPQRPEPWVLARFEVSQNNLRALADKIGRDLSDRQQYIRGLYTGGTLAYEALVILQPLIDEVYSNTPLEPKFKLLESSKSTNDSILDLGDEEFTAGRAHPMLDPTIRKIRLIEEAKDPEVAIIIMDFMLGYGSHPDPVGAMLTAITEAGKTAQEDGRTLPILAHVCGTEQDPQKLSHQTEKLRSAGVEVFPTNALMVVAAALVSRKGRIGREQLEKVQRGLLGIGS